ncbi:MAG: glycosyltransferase family 39 protein [Chloroflexi bacterium]|nr:glycosyltransferase family 39 protein [Chloroflexota bacterium]
MNKISAPKFSIAALVFIFFAFALRLYQLDAMALRADEAANLYLAAQDPSAIVRALTRDDPHAPLYYIILHAWLDLAGQSEIALRFPNIFSGTLTVALLGALARVFFPNRRALAALGALFAAASPSLVWDSQDAYMYSLLTVAILASLILFARFRSQKFSRWQWGAYVLVTTAGFYLHYFAIFPQIAQGALWLYWSVTRQLARRARWLWLAAQVSIAILFLPWLIAAFSVVTTTQTILFPSADWFEMLQRSVLTFTVGRVDARLMVPLIDPAFGNLFALGFIAIFSAGVIATSRDPRARAAWVALGIYLFAALGSFFIFSILRFPIFDERYVIYLTPIFLILLAYAVTVLSRARAPWLAIFFVLAASAYSLNNYFHVPAYRKSPDWRAFTRELLAHARAGDVLIQNYPDPALPYYLNARVPRVLLPRTSSDTRAAIAQDLDQLAQKYARLWLQPVPFSAWDSEGYVVEWFERHTRALDTFYFRGVELGLYLPAQVALESADALDATFDARVRLRAFEITRGENRRLVLYWQALAPVSREYTVFVHLYNSDEQLVWQKDNAPVRGTFSTREWHVTELIVDQYDLNFPSDLPRGKYRLMVGLYDSVTRERARATDARGQMLPDNRALVTILE